MKVSIVHKARSPPARRSTVGADDREGQPEKSGNNWRDPRVTTEHETNDQKEVSLN